MVEENQIDVLNRIYRNKNKPQEEDIPKEFKKVISVGKTNLHKDSLLFIELVVEDKDSIKNVVLMFSKPKMKFLIQRLKHKKYGLMESNGK